MDNYTYKNNIKKMEERLESTYKEACECHADIHKADKKKLRRLFEKKGFQAFFENLELSYVFRKIYENLIYPFLEDNDLVFGVSIETVDMMIEDIITKDVLEEVTEKKCSGIKSCFLKGDNLI